METLTAMTDPAAIKSAYSAFRDSMHPDDVIRGIRIGTSGGGDVCDLGWFESTRLWCIFYPSWREGSDLSLLLGYGRPSSREGLAPLVQLNYDYKNPSRKMQGRYLMDDAGTLSVGHTGSTRLVRKTLSVLTHRPEWNNHLVEVVWPPNTKPNEKVILLGPIGHPQTLARLGVFVKDIHDMKAAQPMDKNLIIP